MCRLVVGYVPGAPAILVLLSTKAFNSRGPSVAMTTEGGETASGQSGGTEPAGQSGGSEPADTMRRRAGERTWKVSLLLGTGRRWLTLAFVASFFVALVVLGWLDPVGLRESVAAKDPIETLFQALATAIVTGVTLVVAINQLVLSQELGAVSDQRERMNGSLEFREAVAEDLGEPVSPLEPAAFLTAILDATGDRADALEAAMSDEVPNERRESVRAFVETVREHGGSVADRLAGSTFGSFAVVDAALDYNYSWKLAEARRLQAVDDDLPADASAALADVETLLGHYGVAREHVKTLYFQWELVDLSRGMLLAAIPALLTAIGMILFVDTPGSITGATLGVDNLVWVVAGATSVALLPFALLFATILRIATVAKRTLAIGPFVLRETDGGTPTRRE